MEAERLKEVQGRRVGNGKSKPGGGGGRDMVMESRHLLGVFLGIVVLCGVFFTLGYVMGRTQYDTSVRAAISPNREKPAGDFAGKSATDAAASPAAKSGAPVPAPSDWNFYRSTESKAGATPLKPAPKTPEKSVAAAAPKPAPPKSASKLLKAPLIPRGAIVLQVAALTRDGDALALAEALQQKGYPSYVLSPSSDNLYRVQVGPYADASSADQARRSLERDGFKAITKR